MFGKKKKRSFLEKITGSVHVDDFEEFEDDELDPYERDHHQVPTEKEEEEEIQSIEQEPLDGQLAVDVFDDEDYIIVKSMVAGVRPSDLDIDITRDMVTIRGQREETHEVSDKNYYHRELYWGSFSRNILLPEEVDVEEAEAVEKNGLLMIRLPKLDKNKRTKLSVKSK